MATSSCSTVALIPGPQGPAGANGTNGTNGLSAFTTANSFTMPAEGGQVVLVVGSTAWMAPGMIVWVVSGGAQGYFQVTTIGSATSVTLQNLRSTATGAYSGNSAPGTLFANMAQVVAAGLQGPTGSTLTGVLLVANNLSDVASTVDAQDNLGLGTAATRDAGVLANELPPIDTTFTDGDSVWATGAGLQTKTQVQAQTALALVPGTDVLAYSSSIQSLAIYPTAANKYPLAGGPGVWTEAGISVYAQSLLLSADASAARTNLGIASGTGDMLSFQHQELDGTDGAAFVQGAWLTVPLNTEVVDTGNHGSIAANNVMLDAGTYRFHFGVVARTPNASAGVQGRLFNVSDAGVINNDVSGVGSYSTVDYDDTGHSQVCSEGRGRFTIASSKTIQLQGQISLSGTFGKAKGFAGSPEVYSWLELLKE